MFQDALLCSISVNCIFDTAKHRFHEYGLRTDPPTENTSVGHGKQGNRKNSSNHDEPEDEEILGPEYGAEDDELTFRNIELQ
ncbi:hypothetical protein D3C86_1670180 [compost metagenome]